MVRPFLEGSGSIQNRAQLFEKGAVNWSFYGVKIRGSSRPGLGSTFPEGPKLGLGFLGLAPSLLIMLQVIFELHGCT